MDQKEIDDLLKKGSLEVYNQKQEDIKKNIDDKPKVTDLPDEKSKKKKGKVMGQLSRVTEESEAGTNMVMSFLENVLNTVSKQHDFVKDISNKYKESPSEINIDEVLNFVNDSLCQVEENIFNAMDAFQFQDIGRQKLMKVMHTLAKLNEYLNELLSGDSSKETHFGTKIEEKTLEQDKSKKEVDNIVAEFKGTDIARHSRNQKNPK